MNERKNATDFLIGCDNPELFDKTIQNMGAAALVQQGDEYIRREGCYVMRVFGDPGFLKFAIKNQGYGNIIKELPELV